MKKRFLLSIPLLCLFLSAYTAFQQDNADIHEAVEATREALAPDSRVAVFDITWKHKEGRLVLKGEVDNPGAKARLLEALRKAGYDDIDMRIVTLPHPDLGKETFGVVRVSVGKMRREPRYTSELVTQVLMGTPLKVLKRSRNWFYVQSPDGYLGWMSAGLFERMDEHALKNWNDANLLIITGYFDLIYEEPTTSSLPVSDVIIGNRIKKTGTTDHWFSVDLPDGRSGYIGQSHAENYREWLDSRSLTRENIAKTAKKFIGVPYLWGGTSAKGFDCSGLTKTVFWLNGKDLSRDSSQQIHMGEHVDHGEQFENLKKGDLLFFGRAETSRSPERIVHVGIYLGGREFIHASYLVRINSLDPDAPHFDAYEYNRFVRARRLIP